MAIAQFETYVIQPGLGDPIPRIGSGMRIVQVKLGWKWVRIKGSDGRVTRLLMTKWLQKVPHFRYQGERLAEVFSALSKWRR